MIVYTTQCKKVKIAFALAIINTATLCNLNVILQTIPSIVPTAPLELPSRHSVLSHHISRATVQQLFFRPQIRNPRNDQNAPNKTKDELEDLQSHQKQTYLCATHQGETRANQKEMGFINSQPTPAHVIMLYGNFPNCMVPKKLFPQTGSWCLLMSFPGTAFWLLY